MATFSELKTVVASQFARSPDVAYLILGSPGGGKSALAKDIGKSLGFDQVVEFEASLRDPVDIMGTPRNNGVVTEWVPPKELYQLRTGRNLLIIEELPDCNMSMQNALCRLIYDRHVNDLHLSPETCIVATGNRSTDKSGANKLSTKLGNRLRIREFDINLDDWCAWAIDNDVPVEQIQYIRWKPDALTDFSPDRPINPSPRAWERVAKIDTNLPPELFFGEVAGDVGEGRAAEYTGFRRTFASLPDIDSIVMNPSRADVPTDPIVLYALTGALAHRSSKDNFDRMSEYLGRMPDTFNVMATRDAIHLHPEIKQTKAYVHWAIKYANVLI
jgi:hypothetical protein